MRWHFTDWSGDFRLESDGPDKCVLTVISPTPSEIKRLGEFLSKARRWPRKWIGQHIGFVPNGEVKVPIAAPLAKAGRLLLGEKAKGTLTAVVSTKGHVKAVTDGDAAKVEKEASKPDAKAATTVRRPTLCCPMPQPGPDVRASEVLREFCTPRQWKEWEQEGKLHCYGNLSGRLYEIAHRHHPLAIERGKIVWDCEGGHIMHAYDWSVPPPEEVLTMKLVLEHAEHWIRNQSGGLRVQDESSIYHDPFMAPDQQWADGLEDAAFVSGMGRTLATFARILAPQDKPKA